LLYMRSVYAALSSTHVSPSILLLIFSHIPRPTPTSTLFPYTTLFRSRMLEKRSFDKPLHLLHRTYTVCLPMIFKSESINIPYTLDRKSTRLNSSHVSISYAVFCLKKKKTL